MGERYKPKEISAKLRQVEVMSGQGAAMAENDHAVAEAGVKVVGVSDLPAHPWRT